MANTFTQIHLHLVFAVKFRKSLIRSDWKDRLYQYITGIVQQNGHKMIIINGMPDHLHILIGLRPNQSISDLLQDIKGSQNGSTKTGLPKKNSNGRKVLELLQFHNFYYLM
ncbi:MAG: IS200/IS605 family transposase [Salinimicrobium sp.]